MYTLPDTSDIRRSLLVNTGRPVTPVRPIGHVDRVKQELRALGVSTYGMLKMESRYLPHIIHPNEHIGGVLYGRTDNGSAMLIATDRRVIFLDKKPLFINEDEITYDVVSGINFSHAGFGTTVTLHTRIKDYKVMTLNKQCANGFVHYIESRRLEHPYDNNQERLFGPLGQM